MKVNNKFKKKINKSVVRIIAESIDINWKLPYLIEEPLKGQGTGFFIDNIGHILTCAHVVNSAKNVYIEIPNISNDKYYCDIIGICPSFDIALLKTKYYKPKDYLHLGDSDKLEVKQEVQVVGYPTSYSGSSRNGNNLKYTVGVINGQQRGLIQTDSAINPGNSGGPLIYKNKVVGINSRKLTGNSLDNIGFSIPINNYKIIKDDFKKRIVYRPDLLLEFNNGDSDIIKIITKKKATKGIIVSRIFENSVFQNTTLQVGSIITEIDNIKINNYGFTYNYRWIGTPINIENLLNNYKNDSIIKIKYYNNDKKEMSNIKLVPFIYPTRNIYSTFEKVDYFILCGIVFMNFSLNHILSRDIDYVNIFLKYAISCTEELLKERVIISFIYPNGKINVLNNIKQDTFIESINDIEIKRVSDMMDALNKPIIIKGKEFIKIKSSNKKYVTIPIIDVVKEDINLSELYNYKLNDFHYKYIKKNKSIEYNENHFIKT
jgi:serine protease Do